MSTVDELPSGDPPEGYEWVDLEEDERWSADPANLAYHPKCRRHPCPNPPVAILWRHNRRAMAAVTPWAYCADHLYGRWIENGRVMVRRLRPVEP